MVVEIVLGTLLLVEGYVIWNLMKKTETLETWIENFTETIENVQSELKKIDATGHFESDDEVGAIFEQIKTTTNELQQFKGEELDAS